MKLITARGFVLMPKVFVYKNKGAIMIKKIFAFLLVFSIIFSFTSCKTKKTNTNKNDKTVTTAQNSINSINLLYNKSDSFNPYTAVTENNRNLCSLIFESLIKTDNNFNPILKLAGNVELDGNKCTVTIIDAVFSDGSPVSADDIVYSYNVAKKSGGIYSSHLYEVVSATASSSKTVVFNLSRKDPYFKNLLDFPVFKANSDKSTNTDGVVQPPIGCGRYIPSPDTSKLLINDNYYGKKGTIKEINLIHAPDDDSLSHYIEVGASDLYFNSLSDSRIYRMSGKKTEVNLNQLVFLGVNQNSNILQNRELRYAVSSAINRDEICSNIYFNNAVPATGYFNPCLSEVKAVQSIKTSPDNQITVENLSKIGYNNKDSEGYFVNSNGTRLVLRLLVNTENRFRVAIANQIASNLKSAGLEIRVIETGYADYINCITTNAFDLYLGEVLILPNFDMSPLVTPGGAMSFGIKTVSPEQPQNAESEETSAEKPDTTCVDVINDYYNGSASITDVAGTLLTEMQQIPILYRKGLFFYKDSIVSGVESTESDIYYSIENYITK